MRWFVVVAMLAWSGPAVAEPAKPVCQRVAISVTKLIGASDKAQLVMSRRCDRDGWSRDAQACFTAADSPGLAQSCLDKLSREQRTELEGDANRSGDARFREWLVRRVLVALR